MDETTTAYPDTTPEQRAAYDAAQEWDRKVREEFGALHFDMTLGQLRKAWPDIPFDHWRLPACTRLRFEFGGYVGWRLWRCYPDGDWDVVCGSVTMTGARHAKRGYTSD